MKIAFHFLFAFGTVFILSCCGEDQPGLQQRITELETRLGTKQQEIVDLQSQLKLARSAAADKGAAVAAASTPGEDRGADAAAVAVAAEELVRTLADKMKPGQLAASGQVAYAGLTLKSATGSTGVAVPFFRDGATSTWRCGWSEAQILASLTGAAPSPMPAVAPAAAAPPPSAAAAQAPATAPVGGGTKAAAQPSSPAPPPPNAGNSLPRLPAGWRRDAASGQVIASDGTPMPALQNGERYGMIQGGEGETPRPVVIGRDGVAKLYVR